MYSNKTWVIAASSSALEEMLPLLNARAARQKICVLPDRVDELLKAPAALLPENSEAVLVIASPDLSPLSALSGIYFYDSSGQAIPVGWLPDAGKELSVYAKASARVLDRPPSGGPLIILGQWQDRFLRVARRTTRWFERHAPDTSVFHWTADRISAPDMIKGLALGPALAMYFGHGRANGWAAYHGIRASHFNDPWPEAMGAMLAISCENASRQENNFSFAEQLALRGVFAGSLAATTETRHTDNQQLGKALCKCLGSCNVSTLAELIAQTDISPEFWNKTPYRFIGDPAAPLAGAVTASQKSAMVFAPAPDDVLPPWPSLGE